MKLVINKDRTVYSAGTWGTKNENDYEILEFDFPEELDEYNKRIVYYLDEERVWDAIVDNKAYITNSITQHEKVKAYVWLTKENTEREADTDFRTKLFEMKFYENENADGIVPTEEQVDGFNTMLTAMNRKIDEVNALEQTILQAEAERQVNENARISNESTRQSNESTRETNEQTRQSQEAERERRTNEAIADIQDKTAEYNANAEAKTTAFNTNATQKTNEFNSNYTQKVNDFNSNATTQTSEFNSNASSKTSAFSSNAETKTNAFNTNATNKTNDFNSNATEKTTAFDNNASTKTSEFNTNAESKTTEFNTNAESKTTAFNENATSKANDFNDNATEKTAAYNTNAQNKIDEYDEHIADYQAQIDELQEEVEELSENMPWDTTEQATEISVDDAAKYSRNKLELFGNTEQTQYTGVQLLDMSDTVNGYFTGDNGSYNANTDGFRTEQYIDVSNNTKVYFRFEGLNNIKIGRFFVQEYDENKNSLRRTSSGVYDSTFTTGQVRKYNKDLQAETKYIRLSAYVLRALENGEYVDKKPVKDEWDNYVKATVSFSDVDIYEPYVGGQPSPSPDYPQPIHVVTGNNTISISNTNYPINLGNIELCKIGDYQDYLYKENGNWYKYGAINKRIFDGSETWRQSGVASAVHNINLGDMLPVANNNTAYNNGTSDQFKNGATYQQLTVGTYSNYYNRMSATNDKYMSFSYEFTTTIASWKEWLSNNNVTAYYVLETATTIQITDETLISQLDAIWEHLQLEKGTNHITVTASDLKPYMKLSYMQDLPSKLDNLDSRLALLE